MNLSANLGNAPRPPGHAYVMRIIKYVTIFTLILLAAAFAYGLKGYMDAISDAENLRNRADDLMAKGRSGMGLGERHLKILLAVEDPAFFDHSGVDFSSPGAGLTTITQSVSKRLAFEQFQPGIGKIKQTGYAIGLEQRLSKEQILALWLDSVEMGKGPGGWMRGFHAASFKIYGRDPSQLQMSEFIRLTAVLIAPASFNLIGRDQKLDDRTRRIQRLVVGDCTPAGFRDVWLEGCS